MYTVCQIVQNITYLGTKLYQHCWIGYDVKNTCYVRKYYYGVVGRAPHHETRLESFKNAKLKNLLKFQRWD